MDVEKQFMRENLLLGPEAAATFVLGSRLVIPSEGISALITEVEAYGGPADSDWPDPAAHCWPGPTSRNAAMFGEAGHLYVYRSYGIHLCANVTCGEDGQGGGILIRSISVLEGEDAVRTRRGANVPFHQLGRGPGNVGQAIGVTMDDYATDLFSADSRIQLRSDAELPGVSAEHVAVEKLGELNLHVGPRVGVRRASERPWRLWLDHPSVSAYRRHKNAVGEY